MSSVCFGAHRYRIGPVGSRLTPDSVRWTHAVPRSTRRSDRGASVAAPIGRRATRCVTNQLRTRDTRLESRASILRIELFWT